MLVNLQNVFQRLFVDIARGVNAPFNHNGGDRKRIDASEIIGY
jgi:hypothetical protein